MQANVPREALVIRFRPTDPEAVLGWAKKEYRRTGYHRLSVFADAPIGSESIHDLHVRLLKASELSGLTADKNKNYYVCTEAAKLLDAGFKFYKDGDDDETDEHYSVDLGVEPDLDDVQRFLSTFGPAEKR